MVKKLVPVFIISILAVITLLSTLYLPNTTYNYKDLAHVECGWPLSFFTYASTYDPQTLQTKGCIEWLGNPMETQKQIHWLPFFINFSIVFVLLYGLLYLAKVLRKTLPNKILLPFAAIIMLVFAHFTWNYFHPHGAVSKEEAVRLYIEGLKKQNFQTIQQLTPEKYNSADAIRKVMKEFEVNTFENVTVDFEDTISSVHWYAKIKGNRVDSKGKKIPFTHTVTVQQLGIYNFDESGRDRWYIMLGTYKSPLPTLGPSLPPFR